MRKFTLFTVAFSFVAMFFGVTTISTIHAQSNATVAQKLAEALELYLALDFEGGMKIANDQLKRADLTPQDSIGIYAVLSLLTYVKGEDFRKQSFTYLDKIAGVGPCVVNLPQDIWPAELRKQWYEILKAHDQIACPEEGPKSDIKTIAIMEFDNFSVGKYQEQLGPLGKGLADFFEHDFGKITSMRVIERDKVNFILQELELQKSGAVDQATAVRAGKVLGAKYMVFGSLTQLDDRQARMMVKVVSVETSEIIASVDKEGPPQYTKMEKELVEELAKKLDVQVSDEASAMIKQGGTESLDATAYYAKGLEYMDRYDYKKAYEFFKKAYDLDKNFVEAKRKMEIYQPLAT
jgi:TolB-like protein